MCRFVFWFIYGEGGESMSVGRAGVKEVHVSTEVGSNEHIARGG